ncbi:predicted protein [Streptomyces albidoflavus]|nr:predicted protein [Streptomyces albidoflavus]
MFNQNIRGEGPSRRFRILVEEVWRRSVDALSTRHGALHPENLGPYVVNVVYLGPLDDPDQDFSTVLADSGRHGR